MANILVVEEYRTVGLLYREVFQDDGHKVFLALSGQGALDLAMHERVDVVVVDDILSDFSAEELFEALKRLQHPLKGILSVSADFGPRHEARSWDGIITKTINFTSLQAEVKRLCQESSSAD
ncbi:MAG: hypothetical protein JSU72_11580 [Deltaproteobacteria bacterium]|nr:MAG: hypothetical protein JSU72_11580 [Deltaproteobacteria bacterium]